MTFNDPQGQPYPAEVQALVERADFNEEGLEVLTAALESVRGRQADVSITDPENILYFESGSISILYLADLVKLAVTEHRALRVCVDGMALKAKVGDYSWSAPLRSERANGGYPR